MARALFFIDVRFLRSIRTLATGLPVTRLGYGRVTLRTARIPTVHVSPANRIRRVFGAAECVGPSGVYLCSARSVSVRRRRIRNPNLPSVFPSYARGRVFSVSKTGPTMEKKIYTKPLNRRGTRVANNVSPISPPPVGSAAKKDDDVCQRITYKLVVAYTCYSFFRKRNAR